MENKTNIFAQPQAVIGACQRCGACCRAGGPALHGADSRRIESGALRPEDLITVRKGELSLDPLSDQPILVTHEFLKISGRGGDWRCRFLDERNSACSIYPHRPHACRLFKCWEPDDILEVMGRDLLTRLDVVAEDDPLWSWVERQERECPLPDLAEVRASLTADPDDEELRGEMAVAVSLDLLFRQRMLAEHDLGVEREMFYFGRPLMTLLQQLGFGQGRREDGK